MLPCSLLSCLVTNFTSTVKTSTPLTFLWRPWGLWALWVNSIDPHIIVLPTTSPAVLPLLLDIPGFSPSVDIHVYLPTWGQEHEWVIALAALSLIVEDVQASHSGVPIYIRGDANVNPNTQLGYSFYINSWTGFHYKNWSQDILLTTISLVMVPGTVNLTS